MRSKPHFFQRKIIFSRQDPWVLKDTVSTRMMVQHNSWSLLRNSEWPRQLGVWCHTFHRTPSQERSGSTSPTGPWASEPLHIFRKSERLLPFLPSLLPTCDQIIGVTTKNNSRSTNIEFLKHFSVVLLKKGFFVIWSKN
jgi:hypothetical protein